MPVQLYVFKFLSWAMIMITSKFKAILEPLQATSIGSLKFGIALDAYEGGCYVMNDCC
jgi:hypothetical protein